MRKHLILLPLLAAATLAACSAQDSTVSAYTSDKPTLSSLDANCSRLATTGDMYRYCMEVGPQQALAAEHN